MQCSCPRVITTPVDSSSRNFAGRIMRPLSSSLGAYVPRNMSSPLLFRPDPGITPLYSTIPHKIAKCVPFILISAGDPNIIKAALSGGKGSDFAAPSPFLGTKKGPIRRSALFYAQDHALAVPGGARGLLAVLTAVPALIQPIHEPLISASLCGATTGRGLRRHAPHGLAWRQREQNAGKHHDESNDSEPQQLKGHAGDQGHNAHDGQKNSNSDRAVVGAEARNTHACDKVCIVVIEAALHLFKDCLLLFRKRHLIPSNFGIERVKS